MKQAMLEFVDLKKNYGKKEAVCGIDLAVPRGELFVLVGPNGAGKSTTLKMTVGLLKPTSGQILIGGIDAIKDPGRAKKLMSYVPDVPYIYERLTPWELLRFMGKLYELETPVIRTRGEELLKFFSLWDVRDTLIEQFSHGMRQKAILAATLLHEPELFILDEPMVGLDPISIKSLKDFLKRKSKGGMTIIFSTHTLTMAEELADRIGIINKGKLIAVGTLEELQRQYQSKENLEHMFMKLVEQENSIGTASP
jgi:ABC-2 type transport system ATP-binding protein